MHAYVHEAQLQMRAGVDPAAVGAAVTTALCGHWDHEGACRWPHNNAIAGEGGRMTFRTLFVAPEADADTIRALIDAALVADDGWSVTHSGPREVHPSEDALADRLTAR
jgi:hypothetical protein